ncbi:lipoprotein LpqV [Mycobacterium senriense]|uniref:Lipoprotein LpqV n=2 Tax=Mycobacterium senriense TaxID=2775496 RepID=A0ABN6IM87_9MYCO|nr:lipoprotein LpqV [Mycobacterium senriense]BCZ23157.1 putative lipoprotein LpqV [Mycobacterium senriense]
MRWRGGRSGRWGAVVAAAVILAVTGCSHGAHSGASSSPPARQSGVANGPGSPPAGSVGLSPGGVTTRVDVPAASTEEEYYQACHAAKEWMDAQPNTGASLFEPYLSMVQASPAGTAGSWNAPWSKLTPARQAAVIVAARAAANDECG